MRRVVLVAALLALAGASDASASRVWLTAGEQFQPVRRHADGPRPALRALLAGPTHAERGRGLRTQVPAGTRLRGLALRGGVAHVSLSSRFLQGVPAARRRSDAQEATLRARLGQVVFTLTQFRAARSVRVVAGGRLAGTGLTRRDYAQPRVYRPPTMPRPNVGGTPDGETTRLQQRLADLGYLPHDAVDGLAGYQTAQAVMAFQAWEGLMRDGVAGPVTKARLAKATRPVPFASGPARRIEVDRARGIALTIRSGRVERVVHVSTGAGANATPPGTFRVFRKELRSWSVPFQVWLPYASYFNNGIAFHEYPDVPAYPASHGCVRVPAPEAQYVYAFAAMGTTVIVR